MNVNDEKGLGLLQHWNDELDGFETSINKLCEKSCQESKMLEMESFFGSLLDCTVLTWMTNASEGKSFLSALYKRLLDLSVLEKDLDDKIIAPEKPYDSLVSLLSFQAALLSLEGTRKFLLDAKAGEI